MNSVFLHKAMAVNEKKKKKLAAGHPVIGFYKRFRTSECHYGVLIKIGTQWIFFHAGI